MMSTVSTASSLATPVQLRLLSPDSVSPNYLQWLADPDVNRFLENRWRCPTLTDVTAFVTSMNDSPTDFLFGIFLDDKHIGNIKIGGIHWVHRYGDVGLLIGDRTCWGKGYATQAIQLASNYAWQQLNLRKLTAGIYANNVGSSKAFAKAGYREVGRLHQHRLSDGQWVDEILVEQINPLEAR
jgi:[ribosomal protein S5]-alanine N-acetyltransferase